MSVRERERKGVCVCVCVCVCAVIPSLPGQAAVGMGTSLWETGVISPSLSTPHMLRVPMRHMPKHSRARTDLNAIHHNTMGDNLVFIHIFPWPLPYEAMCMWYTHTHKPHTINITDLLLEICDSCFNYINYLLILNIISAHVKYPICSY